MAIKRLQSSVKMENSILEPLSHVPSFDDSSIRKMLRSAYDDFVGDELEMQMDNYQGHPVSFNLGNSGERSWGELSHLRERADLRLYWDIHVQKQILFFDREASLIFSVTRDEKW